MANLGWVRGQGEYSHISYIRCKSQNTENVGSKEEPSDISDWPVKGPKMADTVQ